MGSEEQLPDRTITPEQASQHLKDLGYKTIGEVPFGQSDFLDTLVAISQSDKPMGISEVRDHMRRSMVGRM